MTTQQTKRGTNRRDVLKGDGSNNLLLGLAGDDVLRGGGGNDRIVAAAGKDNVNGDSGSDRLLGGGGNDTLRGGTDNDTMTGGGGNDVMVWANGDGTDTMAGGKGIDVANIGGSKDQADVFNLRQRGNDAIFSRSNFQGARTGKFRLTVSDTEQMVVRGNGGNDTLKVGNLSRTGLASVSYFGGAGNDLLDGTATTTQLIVDGGANNDTITGGSAADSLQGGAGNDSISGGAGVDTMTGGAGNDRFLYAGNVFAGGTPAPNAATGISVLNQPDIITDFEIAADQFAFNGTDLALPNLVFSKGAANEVAGNSNVIVLTNGFANAAAAAKAIADNPNVTSGAGVFVYFNTTLGFARTVYSRNLANAGEISVLANLTNIRNVADLANFTANNFVLNNGTAAVNGAANIPANNNVNGTAAADNLVGTAGVDRIAGLDGNDTINGGAGNDTIIGGNGADSLTGGAGGDQFAYEGDVFAGGVPAVNAATGIRVLNQPDVITDFDLAADQFALNGQDLNLPILGFVKGDASQISGDANVIVLTNGFANAAAAAKAIADNPNITAGAGVFAYFNTTLGFTRLVYSENLSQGGDISVLANLTNQTNVANQNLITASNFALTGGNGSLPVINGTAAADNLVGTAATEVIQGGDGADTIAGGEGNDRITGGNGVDSLTGGAGQEQFIYAGDVFAGGAPAVNAATGIRVLNQPDVITDFDLPADQLAFNNQDLALPNLVFQKGTSGQVTGNANLIVLTDGFANAPAAAKAIADNPGVTAGAGVYVYFNTTLGFARAVYSENLSDGGDISVLANLTNVTNVASMADFTVNNFNLIATGTILPVLAGTAAADNLVGTAVSENLLGGDGVDTLTGGDGNDVLIGGNGADSLTGGNGGDRFTYIGNVFAGGTPTLNAATGINVLNQPDVITDFDLANDQIGLGNKDLALSTLSLQKGASGTINANGNLIVLTNGFANAAAAAKAIADNNSITADAGVYVYFNTTLGFARTVYSKDLGDGGDISVLSNLTNVNNVANMNDFTAKNFALV